VAPSDIAFGTARIYERRRDGAAGGMKVFRSRDDALEWLGLDDTPAHPARGS
jgi:hypothetical protein